MNKNIFEDQETKKDFDILSEIFKYLQFWYWFVLTIFVFSTVAYFYLRYTPNTYQTSSKIKILDNSTSSFKMPSDGISLFGRPKVNLENEIEVIQSYRILKQVVSDLNLTTKYTTPGYIIDGELWNDREFNVEWLLPQDSIKKKSIFFTIKVVDGGYKILEESDDLIRQFKKAYTIKGIPFKIVPNQKIAISQLNGGKYSFRLMPYHETVINLVNSITIANVGKQSEILELVISGVNKEKSEDIVNAITSQFDQDGIEDRKLISRRTINFVNERFAYLSKELDSIETKKENYKRVNELSYIEADAASIASKKLNSDSEQFQLETQLELAKLIEKTLKTDKNYKLLPVNIGITSANINQLTTQYNAIVLDREKMLTSGGIKNPTVTVFSDRIVELQSNILESLKGYQKELAMSLAKVNGLKNENSNLFSTIPLKEKVLRSIERQQNIKENLYLLLLQKREEAAINLAITAPSIKVVDYALTNLNPTSPKRNVIYLMALLAGLIIPYGVLYIRFLIDTKIHSRLDFEKSAAFIPVIAEIPFIEEEIRIITSNDRSMLAEAFRMLRTNLNYLLPVSSHGKCPIIYATSSIKGEGKTFVSINLALSLSSMDKKVLLIGSDMRNPQLHKFLNASKDTLGLSNYLHNPTIDWKTLINNYFSDANFDILLAGTIPPNPAELLSNGRFEKLLLELQKEYDYIVVDTPPTILVTDTLLISTLADLTIYVTRADFTDKKLISYSSELSKQGKMKNMAYLINNVGSSKAYGYGYGYGYGYNYGYGYGYSENSITRPVNMLKSIWKNTFHK